MQPSNMTAALQSSARPILVGFSVVEVFLWLHFVLAGFSVVEVFLLLHLPIPIHHSAPSILPHRGYGKHLLHLSYIRFSRRAGSMVHATPQ